MRHRVANRKLGRPKDQRAALLRSLVSELVIHERITTTEAKAKEASRLAERVISFGKKGSVHHRRQALALIPNKEVVKKVFEELAPRYEGRQGGYTRVIKAGTRSGDAAPMAILELVS
jgi:large subunit ribosomal protein L17